MNPLDRITFDSTGFEAHGDHAGVRVWRSPAGDQVSLHHFPIPPNIEADLEDIDGVRAFWRKPLEAGRAIIEVDTRTIQRCRAVRTIIKVAQQPHGMTYLGAFTFPFRDFSYVLKVQCVERGITGVREVVVFEEFVRGVALNGEDDSEEWMADPYDSSVRAPLMRNRAEAKDYDSWFPDHPLARAREVLDLIEKTLTIAPSLHTVPPFRYPASQRDGKPWWRLW